MIPRGIRNNNPFNIRKSNSRWKGLIKSTDPDFCQFSTMTYGLRAGMVLLRNYVRKGYDTPRKIISRFAPSTENDTSRYTDFVCKFTGNLSPDSRITDLTALCNLASRMIWYETGCIVCCSSDLLSICRTFNIKF